jgi:hypothetical protein
LNIGGHSVDGISRRLKQGLVRRTRDAIPRRFFSHQRSKTTGKTMVTSTRPKLALLRRLTMAASLVLLASCPAAAIDQVSLQLKWKHQFQFAGYYAALEQGFYRDAGLVVTIREGGPDIDVAETVMGPCVRRDDGNKYRVRTQRFQNVCISTSDTNSPRRTCSKPLFTVARSASVKT